MSVELAGTAAAADAPDRSLERWLLRAVRSVLVGVAAGIIAVAVRALLPIPAIVLPFFTVTIAICLTTVFAGPIGGVAAMLTGAMLTVYYVLTPGSWRIDGTQWYALLGFGAVAVVILLTAELYRRSEAHRQDARLATARKETEQQRLFASEMSHRLKNALAIVQALASQTFSSDVPEVAKFEGRLKALADAHTLLMDHVERPTAVIGEVVAEAINPFVDAPGRFRLHGPALDLPAQQVVSLTLALHELATNAVKYGALGAPLGTVAIDWEQLPGRVQLSWAEHDGPPVVAPTELGFGTRLLKRAGLGTELTYAPDGVRCAILLPL